MEKLEEGEIIEDDPEPELATYENEIETTVSRKRIDKFIEDARKSSCNPELTNESEAFKKDTMENNSMKRSYEDMLQNEKKRCKKMKKEATFDCSTFKDQSFPLSLNEHYANLQFQESYSYWVQNNADFLENSYNKSPEIFKLNPSSAKENYSMLETIPKEKFPILEKAHNSVFSRLGLRKADEYFNQQQNNICSFDEDFFYMESLPLYQHKRGRLTPRELADCLTFFKDYRASLQNLPSNELNNICEIVLSYQYTFAIIEDVVMLEPQVSICSSHVSSEGCRCRMTCYNLHICPLYVVKNCPHKDCELGHNFRSNQNEKVLKQHFLDSLKSPLLEDLLSVFIDLSPSLQVCKNYNNNGGGCWKKCCFKLHICLNFLADICQKHRCFWDLNHSVVNQQVIKILRLYNISTNESPVEILHTIKSCTLIREAVLNLEDSVILTPNEITSDSSSASGRTGTTWAHQALGSVAINEICFSSVSSTCFLEEEGCPRLHCKTHFHWQVRERNNAWTNLPPAQVLALEQEFSDPYVDHFCLPLLDLGTSSLEIVRLMKGKLLWKAELDEMKLQCHEGDHHYELELRRLDSTNNCPDIFSHPRSFVWYFQDNNKKWVKCENSDIIHNDGLSDITTEDIEKHFRQNPVFPLKFKTDKFIYSFDLKTVRQITQRTVVFRSIKRRPKPLSMINPV